MSEPDEKQQGSSNLSQNPTGSSVPDEEPPSLSEVSNSELLLALEEKFAYRYTDQDPKYMELSEKPLRPPPCVFPWFPKKRRTYRRDNSRGGYSRGSSYNHRDCSPRRSAGDRQWEDWHSGCQEYSGHREYQDHGDGYGQDSWDNPGPTRAD